jgi:glutamate dehydrogenase
MAEFSKAIARLMEERVPAASDPPALRAVLDRMRALLTPIERPFADAFARQLFSKGNLDQLTTSDVQMWAALTVNACRYFVEPSTGAPRVRVFMPDVTRDGWEAPGTVVQATMPDRPFIIDTIREGVQAAGAKLHRLLHPILGVERDRHGALRSIGTPEVVGQHESFVHAEIERVADPAALQAALLARLAALQLATDDYAAMRTSAAKHADALRFRTLPRPWNESAEEVAAFLEWLTQKHFVFLGYREYEFSGQGSERRAALRAGSGLGILRDEARSTYATSQRIAPGLRRRLNEPPLLMVSKTNAESPIHRLDRMDYIGLKQIDASGVVNGECRFLGLFTGKAYAEPSSEVPLLRRKLEAILAIAETLPESHDYLAITALFNTIPKEELLGSAAADLADEIAAIRAAEGHDGIRVLCRSDAIARGVFVVVILASDRFAADLERRIGQKLAQALKGQLLHQRVALDDFERARLHFYVGTPPEVLSSGTAEQLEREFGSLLRTWDDRLIEQLRSEMPRTAADQLTAKYLPAFSPRYRATTDTSLAVRDIRCLEVLSTTRTLQVDVFNGPADGSARFTSIKLYTHDEALVLSECLPMLENLGLRVFEEDHLDVPLAGVGDVRIHTFLVQDTAGGTLDVDRVAGPLSAAMLALRAGLVANDPLNSLVLHAGLLWNEVDILRAYLGHAQQAQVAAHELLVEALTSHPPSAAVLFEAFRTKFDPAFNMPARERAVGLLPDIERRFFASLDTVESVQHDRILRALWATIAATVRTNFYVPPATERARAGQGTLALKIASAELPHLPRPHPLCEIYVHAVHMCGIHLRGSRVARGGIRLSDRPDDFRTEVLGLMKTQTVKNAVIIPAGAKGGFVVNRRSPTGATPAAITAAYRSLIGGLLDLTDNIVHGSVVPPPNVVLYDESDPYLVVAADKGTATFSDAANEIAAEYGFWLGDAFASGGSHGYDHKREAITAKGAWESVRQHFRALDRDADTEPLTVIGIGDMSGDVFGNGLLRSRHLRLRAAFNHQHVFLDPDPNPVASFAERERLFALPRSGWNDYTANLISAGGGVHLRAAKSIALSDPVRKMLGVDNDTLNGEELIRALLRMEADLLWNGGIGTYVKAHDEPHAAAGDTANDGVRVDARDLRVKVVGEGGNLGFTQRARIEYALSGGAINTDAIDNSAGVDLSDHEVNLKIAFGRPVETGIITAETRNDLLAQLTTDVCNRVLADNVRQARILTIDQVRSRTRLNDFRDLVTQLEAEAQLDRQLERLPERETLRARRATFLGLTRPELAVVLAYSKLHLQQALLQSTLPDDPFLEHYLRRYFPEAISERFANAVRAHRLRREIIAVTLGNYLIDAMGMTFAMRIARDTASDLATVVKAWTAVVIVSEAEPVIDQLLLGTPPLTADADLQSATVLEHALDRATKWIIDTQQRDLGIGDLVKAFSMSVGALQHGVGELLSPGERQREQAARDALVTAGVPDPQAHALVRLRRTADLLEIDQIAMDIETPLEVVAEVYYRAVDLVDFEWIRQNLSAVAGEDGWDRRASEGLIEALAAIRRQLTRNLLLQRNEGTTVQRCVLEYSEQHTEHLERLGRLINDIRSARQPTLSGLVVVVHELERLVGR